MQTAWDDGTAPSTDTCGGVACTNIAPETPGYLGYAIRIPSTQSSPLTIYGNGATIESNYTTNVKGTQNYPIVATSAIDWVIDGLGTEDVGNCDGNGNYGAYGSTNCPSPYDSVNNELAGTILLYGFQNIYAKSIRASGPILETFAEPQQVSAAQALED